MRPDHVNVFGKRIPIKYKRLKAKGMLGCYDCIKQEIAIDAGLKYPSDEFWRVYLHEVFHAVFARHSFDQTISPELEEMLVNSFALKVTELFNLELKT